MTMQLLAVDRIIENVVLDKIVHIDKRHKCYHFKWGNSMWEQISMRDNECNPKSIELKEGNKGKLVQYQGQHYKTHEFVLEGGLNEV